MTTLLNIDANAKTVKGQERGYMTAVLYLAPYKASGVNVCPTAELAGCWQGCLNTAGRGGIAKGNAIIATDAGNLPDNAIQRARIRRTEWFHRDRAGFMAALVLEVARFVRKAEKAGLTPCVRLNGTSDIQWELIETGESGKTIFEVFPGVQFYDYTKIPKRFARDLPANYHLSLSYSAASERYAEMCRAAHVKYGAPLVTVKRTKEAKAAAIAYHAQMIGARAVDGDETDLRFTDPARAFVFLYAKGRARQDTTGFVID